MITFNPKEVAMIQDSLSSNLVINDRINGCMRCAFKYPQDFDKWINGAVYWLEMFNFNNEIVDNTGTGQDAIDKSSKHADLRHLSTQFT